MRPRTRLIVTVRVDGRTSARRKNRDAEPDDQHRGYFRSTNRSLWMALNRSRYSSSDSLLVPVCVDIRRR
jgi:hypothetical protein